MGKKRFSSLSDQMFYYMKNDLGKRLNLVRLYQLNDDDAEIRELVEFVRGLYLNEGETISIDDIVDVLFDRLNDVLKTAGNTELGSTYDTKFSFKYKSEDVVLNEFDFDVFKLNDDCREMIESYRAIERVLLSERVGVILVSW